MGWEAQNEFVGGEWVTPEEPHGDCGMKPPEEINVNNAY